MIDIQIVSAIIRRYIYTLRHDLNSFTDAFYQPAMQIFIWGLTSSYIQRESTNLPQIVLVILSGVVFWMILSQSTQDITVGLLREFWDRNLVNLFSSPLRLREWISGVIITGIIKLCFSLALGIMLVLFLYHANIFSYGFYLIPFIVSLLITGWVIGFFIAGLLIRYGHSMQAFAWIGIEMLSPFCAVYYPLSSLPVWMQNVSMLLPPSYIFEGMRQIVNNGTVNYNNLIISFALNILYLLLSIWFFVIMFEKSRKLGLGRLI